MEYLVKMNEKLFKIVREILPKKRNEQFLLISTLIVLMLSLGIHYHNIIIIERGENQMKNKTDLITEKTISMDDKIDSLELNCPEIPSCNCPACPACPSCNCPEVAEKKCPTCPTFKQNNKEEREEEGEKEEEKEDVKDATPLSETDGVDSMEKSNNIFSNFYSIFNNDDEEGDSIIQNNSNSNNSNSSNSSNSNSNKPGEIDGFEKVPGYAIISER